jgi:hypothetical protein
LNLLLLGRAGPLLPDEAAVAPIEKLFVVMAVVGLVGLVLMLAYVLAR